MKYNLGFLLMFLVACDPMTRSPNVYIDSSFKDDEINPLMYGATSWSRASNGELSPKVSIIPHGEAYTRAEVGETNSIFYVRMSNKDRQRCPPNVKVPTGGDVADTFRNIIYGGAIICMDADHLNHANSDPDLQDALPDGVNEVWPIWVITSAHEMGHAIDLDHIQNKDAIMQYGTSVHHYDVGCLDLIAATVRWLFPLPEKCKGLIK